MDGRPRPLGGGRNSGTGSSRNAVGLDLGWLSPQLPPQFTRTSRPLTLTTLMIMMMMVVVMVVMVLLVLGLGVGGRLRGRAQAGLPARDVLDLAALDAAHLEAGQRPAAGPHQVLVHLDADARSEG